MDFKFGKDADSSAGTQKAASGDKNRQTGLLLVLLILVGVGGYLYFFTDLIKPQAEQKPAEPAPQVVKKPLPAGAVPAATEKKDGAVPPATAAQAVSVAQPAKEQPKAAQEPVKPEPAKAAAAAKTQHAAADAKAQKPAESPKSAAAAKPADVQKAAVAGDKKTAVVDKKATTATAGAKKVAEAKSAAEKVKPAAAAAKPATVPAKTAKAAKPASKAAAAAKSSAGPWTVVVGSYMLEDAMAADLARVRKAGLQAAVKPGDRKKAAMHRLFLAEYPDRASAQAALDKLKKNTSDAFVLGQGGKYAVYAGSYLLDSRAASEKERLAAAGYLLTMKNAEVPIQSKSLTAGTFTDKKAADAAVAKLKAEGLKATLQH